MQSDYLFFFSALIKKNNLQEEKTKNVVFLAVILTWFHLWPVADG